MLKVSFCSVFRLSHAVHSQTELRWLELARTQSPSGHTAHPVGVCRFTGREQLGNQSHDEVDIQHLKCEGQPECCLKKRQRGTSKGTDN